MPIVQVGTDREPVLLTHVLDELFPELYAWKVREVKGFDRVDA